MGKFKKRSKTSNVWNFFTLIEKSDSLTSCNICKRKISYKSTTSNLKKHLKSIHPTVNTNIVPERSSDSVCTRQSNSSAISDNIIEYPEVKTNPDTLNQSSTSLALLKQDDNIKTDLLSPLEKDSIDQSLLKLFTIGLQPFDILEDKSFMEFVNALNPTYLLPNKKYISKTIIPTKYEECLNECRQIVNNALSISLTTECWSSISSESFLNLTAHFLTDDFDMKSVLLECAVLEGHHTTTNVATEIQKIVKEWEIPSKKLVLVTSDNAANASNVIKMELDWKHFDCFAHTLNRIMQTSLDVPELSAIIDKVKCIVSHLRRCNISTEKLMTYQLPTGKEPLELIQDVKTQWNFTYYMLERFVLLEEAMENTDVLANHNLLSLTPSEWKVIKQLCQALGPFEKLAKLMSGGNYKTASYVLPITNGLFEVCRNLKTKEYSPIIRSVLTNIEEQLNERFQYLEQNNILSITSFLDPRFKIFGFSNAQSAENTKKRIIDCITDLISKEHEADEPVNTNEEPEDLEMSVWGAFEKALAKTQPKGTFRSRAMIEVQRYLEENVLPKTEDCLKWWRENRYNFPYMSKLAQENLNAQATSVPCERLFSNAGLNISDKRIRLSAAEVKEVLFLNTNSSFLTSN